MLDGNAHPFASRVQLFDYDILWYQKLIQSNNNIRGAECNRENCKSHFFTEKFPIKGGNNFSLIKKNALKIFSLYRIVDNLYFLHRSYAKFANPYALSGNFYVLDI